MNNLILLILMLLTHYVDKGLAIANWKIHPNRFWKTEKNEELKAALRVKDKKKRALCVIIGDALNFALWIVFFGFLTLSYWILTGGLITKIIISTFLMALIFLSLLGAISGIIGLFKKEIVEVKEIKVKKQKSK